MKKAAAGLVGGGEGGKRTAEPGQAAAGGRRPAAVARAAAVVRGGRAPRRAVGELRLANEKEKGNLGKGKEHRVGPKSRAKLQPLIRILSQNAGQGAQSGPALGKERKERTERTCGTHLARRDRLAR